VYVAGYEGKRLKRNLHGAERRGSEVYLDSIVAVIFIKL
jgi:hypothetical protein